MPLRDECWFQNAVLSFTKENKSFDTEGQSDLSAFTWGQNAPTCTLKPGILIERSLNLPQPPVFFVNEF